MKVICPNNKEHKEFATTAHVTQEWKVDDSGEFIETINDCLEVTHTPDRDDCWNCTVCGAEAKVFDQASDLIEKIEVLIRDTVANYCDANDITLTAEQLDNVQSKIILTLLEEESGADVNDETLAELVNAEVENQGERRAKQLVTLVRVRHWENTSWQDKFLIVETDQPEQTFRNAIKEFLLTEEGKKQIKQTNGDFNWGDAVMVVPNATWEKHGISPLADGVHYHVTDTFTLTVDQDEVLVPEENFETC